ncbi:MAG: hypothetical protein ACC645_11460 [Pirellulales bacterium]
MHQHFLALVRELAESYDCDVMELDFLRFPYYFDRDDIDQHRTALSRMEKMT